MRRVYQLSMIGVFGTFLALLAIIHLIAYTIVIAVRTLFGKLTTTSPWEVLVPLWDIWGLSARHFWNNPIHFTSGRNYDSNH